MIEGEYHEMQSGRAIARNYRLHATPADDAGSYVNQKLSELEAEGWGLIGQVDVDPHGFWAEFVVERPRPRLRLVKP